MVNFRKISKEKYILAGIISLLVFTLGLTLGIILEDYRYTLVQEINQEQDVNYLSLQLQYVYLSAFSSHNNCPILYATLKKTIKDLSESLEEVISFQEEDKISSKRELLVQRRYVIDNLRYWILAQESKQRCNLDIVPIIYFYSRECASCPDQGSILTFFKNVFGEKVLIFPINVDLVEEEPMVEIVTSQFNITELPTLVINNKKYKGIIPKDQLQDLICASLREAPPCSE